MDADEGPGLAGIAIAAARRRSNFVIVGLAALAIGVVVIAAVVGWLADFDLRVLAFAPLVGLLAAPVLVGSSRTPSSRSVIPGQDPSEGAAKRRPASS